MVVFGIELLDKKFHIDDPVGAVGVHCLNGIWGTIAVGLFATKTPVTSAITGLFYGGGFKQLGIQLLGITSVVLWVGITSFIMFKIIAKTMGLRASAQEEIGGLDIGEHGSQAYPEFITK